MSYDVYTALGLSSNPFSPATSTTGYFHTLATQRILEEIQFGIAHRRGFMLLAGEVGVGKTSLLLQLLDRIHSSNAGNLRTAWVFNTVLDRTELLHTIAADFGLEPKPDASFSELLTLLNNFFLEVNTSDGNCAIIVDEAHNLDGNTLESLRLLSNLESDEKKLVQIILSGQPELQSRLDQKEFRQLSSRIAISNVLPPLQKNELKRYVDYKLSKTRSRLELPSKAVSPLFEATQGNLRLINLIMERALHVMYALDKEQLETSVIRKAIKEISAFQKELRQRNEQKKWKRWTLICLVLAALATSGYLLLPVVENRLAEQMGAGPALDRKVVLDEQEESRRPVDRIIVQFDNIEDTAEFRQFMRDFFAPFNLDGYNNIFAQALHVGSLDALNSKLPEELKAVPLVRLPENAKIEYSLFPWNRFADDGPEWIALWSPPVTIKSYFPDYTGPDIKHVQERLLELGYYEGNVDGYFGSFTWRGLTAFQEDFGLEMTGTPTDETLFWLYSGAEPPELEDEP